MKNYRNGPVQDQSRSCTDLCCFIILALFVLAMFIIAIYSWSSGNFSKLTTPYDPDGKGCGIDHPDHPFIYFAEPTISTLWKTVCVKQCPNTKQSTLNCAKNSQVSCSGDIEIYPTVGFQNRVCLPKSEHLKKQIGQALGAQGLDQKIGALQKSWHIILASVPIAIVLSLLFMLIMRCLAGIFVYLLVFIAIAALIIFGIFLLTPHQSASFLIKQSRTAAVILGIVLIVIAVVIFIAFCCFRKRIKLASIVVKVSARFVNQNCLILLLPLILFVVMLAFVILWILEALGYYSLGTPIHEKHQLPFQHFQTSNSIKALGLIHVFQLFWVLFFLIQTGDFIIAGATCSWYFQRQSPYSESTDRYRKFHIGSVAVGSFFLALIGFIKFLYELLTPQQTQEQGCMYNWKKFCGCCCYLCVNYLFNCFNSGAYTMQHLTGDSYCTSAWDAISLKIKQPAISVIVAFMGVLFSVLVRIGITAATCALCYIILKEVEPYSIDVPDVVAPMIVIGLIAFTISSFFVSLYSEAMEAIYVCYIADKDAGGDVDKAPEQLRQFLQQARKDNHFE